MMASTTEVAPIIVTALFGRQDTAFFDASSAAATAIGLTGTPTVLINGTKLGDLSVDQIVSEIENRVAAGS